MLSRVYIASSVTRTENKIVKASWGPGGQAVCGVSVVVAKKHAQTWNFLYRFRLDEQDNILQTGNKSMFVIIDMC
ncbi:uncharacterized protein [Triticum aestivum]|uniref:uncharacterized protein isoform X5 n=1 Tax=Triticum aestivum TaxID=4565 RepID=UPI001D025E37|nr:uncharacterized protein LOC123156825 isoform X5 [Triticum aestivum]